jgi:hypothetical protein
MKFSKTTADKHDNRQGTTHSLSVNTHMAAMPSFDVALGRFSIQRKQPLCHESKKVKQNNYIGRYQLVEGRHFFICHVSFVIYRRHSA